MAKTSFTMARAVRLPAVLALLIGSAAPAAAAAPFEGFAGTWSGNGQVTTTDGAQEEIRCKADYGVDGGGSTLHINVDCASDSYRVDLVSTVRADGASLSGSWQETTRQIGGDLTGRIPSPDTMQASLQAMGGGLQLAARTNGQVQAITITSQGSGIQSASITLHKR